MDLAIQRFTQFQGKRRIGLDSNILIKLYNDPYIFDAHEARIFDEKDLIFVHRMCLVEFKKYLIKTKEYADEDAKSEVLSFIKKHNIDVLTDYITDDEIRSFESEANAHLKSMNRDDLVCHFPDSLILLAFKKNGINRVISTDNSFRECAKFMGIDAETIPSFDAALSKKLRDAFIHKKNFKK